MCVKNNTRRGLGGHKETWNVEKKTKEGAEEKRRKDEEYRGRCIIRRRDRTQNGRLWRTGPAAEDQYIIAYVVEKNLEKHTFDSHAQLFSDPLEPSTMQFLTPEENFRTGKLAKRRIQEKSDRTNQKQESDICVQILCIFKSHTCESELTLL